MLKLEMLNISTQLVTSITLFVSLDQTKPQAEDPISEQNHKGMLVLILSLPLSFLILTLFSKEKYIPRK